MDCVIDTNVLVYELLEDSEHHEKAKELLESVTGCLVPTTVIEEFVHVMNKLGISNNIIKGKMEELLNAADIDVLPISVSNISDAIRLTAKYGLSFRDFNDQLIISAAKAENAQVMTFDLRMAAECSKEGVKTIK